MLAIEIVLRYLRRGRYFLNLTTLLSLIGIALGVACLVVSMAVVSGFYKTLKVAITDVMGHVFLVRMGSLVEDTPTHREEIRSAVPDTIGVTPFIRKEGVLGFRGQLNGVYVQGVDTASFESTLNLKKRLVQGRFDLGPQPDGQLAAVVGRELAKKFSLKVGDVFPVVFPIVGEGEFTTLKKKIQKFRITGIISSGRYDFDARFLLVSMKEIQNLFDYGNRVSGYMVLTRNADQVVSSTSSIRSQLENRYWVMTWLDDRYNLFKAAEIEKVVLFFVLLIMVVVACFNVTTTLYVSVVRRYRAISIFRVLGAPSAFVSRLFMYEGLAIGLIGGFLGVVLGLLICWGFLFLQEHIIQVPADVYRLDHIGVDIRWGDVAMIILASGILCFLATLAPSRRGARLSPLEGLRYD